MPRLDTKAIRRLIAELCGTKTGTHGGAISAYRTALDGIDDEGVALNILQECREAGIKPEQAHEIFLKAKKDPNGTRDGLMVLIRKGE